MSVWFLWNWISLHYVTSAYYSRHQFTCHAFVIFCTTGLTTSTDLSVWWNDNLFLVCLCCKTLSFIASLIVIVVCFMMIVNFFSFLFTLSCHLTSRTEITFCPKCIYFNLLAKLASKAIILKQFVEIDIYDYYHVHWIQWKLC